MANLRTYLKENGLGQNEFARANGIDPSLLSRYMSTDVNIPLPVAVRIERATDGQVPVTAWIRAEDDGGIN